MVQRLEKGGFCGKRDLICVRFCVMKRTSGRMEYQGSVAIE